MERFFLRRLRGQDLALLIWGGDPYNLPVPAALSGGLRVGGAVFPIYRIFIVGVAVTVGLGLWLLLDRTRAGAMIRAAVDDGEMAQGVGINVPRISLAVFGLGAALAALGGVIGAGFLGVYPGADFEVLPYAFVVVIVGGLGSLPGAMAGSLLVGLLDNFGKALFPELAYFTLFAPMGKTTLIRSIIGFTPPRRGRVRFKGQDITRWPPYRMVASGMALVPQGRRVFPSLTVRENLEVARSGRGPWTLERVHELFPRLHERGRNRANKLSGGEQQMLAIGRALMAIFR